MTASRPAPGPNVPVALKNVSVIIQERAIPVAHWITHRSQGKEAPVQQETVPAAIGNADAYDGLFAEYPRLHDYIGRGANDVMKHLKAMRKEALA